MCVKKTISFAKGKGSIAHNNRDFFTDNIDRDRTQNNITYVQQDLEIAYDEIFGQALKDYNAKQKRSDRKIESYLEHIRRSKNGECLFHEVVVQLGDKDDSGFGTDDFERCRDVLDKYMKSFQERNKHIHVFNAVMHLDESTPHLHISFIPVAKDYKRGLSVRNSLSKSMEIFANENQKVGILGWYERERQELKECAREYDIEITQKNDFRAHLTLPEYKESMRELESVRELKNEFEDYLEQTKEELSEKIKELDEKKEKLEGANEKIEQLKRIETGIIQELAFDKQLKQFGFNYQSELKESDIKKIPMVGEVVKIETYRSLEKKYEVVLEQNEKLKMSNEFNPAYQNSLRRELEKKYESLSQSFNLKNEMNECLTKRVNELQKENKELEQEKNFYKAESRFFKKEFEEAKECIKSFRNHVTLFMLQYSELNLIKEFNGLLKQLNFKWSDGIQRDLDKIKRSLPKKQSERTLKQERGME